MTSPVPADSHPSAGRLIALAIWLGLAYGLVEATESTILGWIPDGQFWATRNSPTAYLVAPWFYAGGFAVIAILILGLSRSVGRLGFARKVRWDVVLASMLVALSGFAMARVPNGWFSSWSSSLLGLGLGVTAFRVYRPRRERLALRASETLPRLAGGAVAIGLLVLGGQRVWERVQVARLPAPQGSPPNVLLLVLDTQRADHLSAYHYSRPTSPRIDRLAAEGTLFEQAYASSSWSLPSHATLMTGRALSEHRAGVISRRYLDGRYPTMAEAFQKAGYATGGFVANTFWAAKTAGMARGFVHFEDLYGNLGDAMARSSLGNLIAFQVLPRLGLLGLPGRKTADQVDREFLQWQGGLHGRPFFAFLNYMDVHGPNLPISPFRGMFSAPGRGYPRERADWVGYNGNYSIVPIPEKLQGMLDAYDESIRYLDDRIGCLLDSLQARGILDQTIVILTSDHGQSIGGHRVMGHGNSLYVDQLQVPLILRYPAAISSGARITRAVGIDQIPRTVLELVGLDANAFPGQSLLRNTGDSGLVFSEVDKGLHVTRSFVPTAHGWLKSITDGHWHYILWRSGQADELYDLSTDPDELSDLSDSTRFSPVVARFRAEIERRIRPDTPAVAEAGGHSNVP